MNKKNEIIDKIELKRTVIDINGKKKSWIDDRIIIVIKKDKKEEDKIKVFPRCCSDDARKYFKKCVRYFGVKSSECSTRELNYYFNYAGNYNIEGEGSVHVLSTAIES